LVVLAFIIVPQELAEIQNLAIKLAFLKSTFHILNPVRNYEIEPIKKNSATLLVSISTEKSFYIPNIPSC
jgi:hypothetical protein